MNHIELVLLSARDVSTSHSILLSGGVVDRVLRVERSPRTAHLLIHTELDTLELPESATVQVQG